MMQKVNTSVIFETLNLSKEAFLYCGYYVCFHHKILRLVHKTNRYVTTERKPPTEFYILNLSFFNLFSLISTKPPFI